MSIRISCSDVRGPEKPHTKGTKDTTNTVAFVTFVDFVRIDLMYSSPKRVPHAKY